MATKLNGCLQPQACQKRVPLSQLSNLEDFKVLQIKFFSAKSLLLMRILSMQQAKWIGQTEELFQLSLNFFLTFLTHINSLVMRRFYSIQTNLSFSAFRSSSIVKWIFFCFNNIHYKFKLMKSFVDVFTILFSLYDLLSS